MGIGTRGRGGAANLSTPLKDNVYAKTGNLLEPNNFAQQWEGKVYCFLGPHPLQDFLLIQGGQLVDCPTKLSSYSIDDTNKAFRSK